MAPIATPAVGASKDAFIQNAKKPGARFPAFVRMSLGLIVLMVVYGVVQMDGMSNMMKSESVKETVVKERTIKQISILGERNSGTRWTYSHLTKCFNHSIPVVIKLTRYKHWFQEPVSYRYPHDTLVIAQFRNPYDWLKAMQHVPHHSPNHLQYRRDPKWKQFLTSSWDMERIGEDVTYNNQSGPCQEHFKWRDLKSCHVEPVPKSSYTNLKFSNHQPFYEMRNDKSGKPYDNIMEMRSDKILNFLSVKDYEGIADLWVVQYEHLLRKGTQGMIDKIANWTGVTPKCDASPPQDRASRAVEREMAAFIQMKLNWTTEALIGYTPLS